MFVTRDVVYKNKCFKLAFSVFFILLKRAAPSCLLFTCMMLVLILVYIVIDFILVISIHCISIKYMVLVINMTQGRRQRVVRGVRTPKNIEL